MKEEDDNEKQDSSNSTILDIPWGRKTGKPKTYNQQVQILGREFTVKRSYKEQWGHHRLMIFHDGALFGHVRWSADYGENQGRIARRVVRKLRMGRDEAEHFRFLLSATYYKENPDGTYPAITVDTYVYTRNPDYWTRYRVEQKQQDFAETVLPVLRNHVDIPEDHWENQLSITGFDRSAVDKDECGALEEVTHYVAVRDENRQTVFENTWS